MLTNFQIKSLEISININSAIYYFFLIRFYALIMSYILFALEYCLGIKICKY